MERWERYRTTVKFFFIILGSIFLLNVIWWLASAQLAAATNWRHLNTAFLIFEVVGLAWLISGRLWNTGWDRILPKAVVTALLIWHMLVLPITVVMLLIGLPVAGGVWLTRHFSTPRTSSSSSWERDHQHLSRREFLGAAAAIAPPLVTFTLTGIALRQLSGFRVRRLILPVSGLPVALDGMTLIQVSDLHVGRFTSGRVLDDVVRVTNDLGGDLVLLTGDLINDALSDLDHGIELAKKMEARFGTYLIEGNHDLIENGPEFERRVKQSGIPFLLDESAIVSVRDEPIQLLGLSWTRVHENRDVAIGNAVRQLLARRQPDVFSILLAHHPHAFDAAAEAGLPLTLSGHTHGGQLMLNERAGFGPAMFHYWSGLYTKGLSKLVVSNGVGNWFPLRINAPAEIIHITLTRVG